MVFELAGKLKSFVEKVSAKFNITNGFNFLSGNTLNIHISSAPTPKQPDAIPLHKLTPELKEELRQVLLEYHERGLPLLTDKSAGLLEYVRHHQEEGKEVIDALHGIIRSEDILALRASYILRAKYKSGEDIQNLRDDIIRKYGERGRKLTNLCTSGYVDDAILPTYKAMRKAPEFKVQDFITFFDVFVDESAFAVFVNSSMTAEGTSTEILKKLERNRSYGKYYVHVHGLGLQIVKTITKAVKTLLERHPNITQVGETRVEGSIFVHLEWLPEVEPLDSIRI